MRNDTLVQEYCWCPASGHNSRKDSATGTRTRVARVRAEYPNQLDYSGFCAGHAAAFNLFHEAMGLTTYRKLPWLASSNETYQHQERK